MAQIIVSDLEGSSRPHDITSGLSLMEMLQELGYEEILAICGGCVSCATCHVHIVSSPQELPPIEEDEAMLLELADNFDEQKSRLSCQIELDETYDGLEIQLVDNQ